jgi:hypothetical protein
MPPSDSESTHQTGSEDGKNQVTLSPMFYVNLAIPKAKMKISNFYIQIQNLLKK